MRDSVRPGSAASGEEGPTLASPFGLTEKQRGVLRLLAQGHDAKSAAGTLGVSVHTIHERLREARVKMGASSSRAAARLLAESEAYQFFGSEKVGVIHGAPTTDEREWLRPGAADGSRFLSRWGTSMLFSAFAVATIVAASHLSNDRPSPLAVPLVVATSPEAGATIAPGPLVLSVTFDRPMRRQSYSFVRKNAATYPDCGVNKPVQSADGRTFTMRCRTQAAHHYEVWFNYPPYENFKGENGIPAVPYGIRFRTR